MSVLIGLLLLPVCASASQDTHPFSVHDMLAMHRISNPTLSPDGKYIVFELRKTDLENNRGRTDLWLVCTDTAETLQMTTDAEEDICPCWSPDSKLIYFISKRSGSAQIWKIKIDGGEAQQITELPLDVSNLILSPDGKKLVFTMEVFPDCNTIQATKEKLDQLEERKATGRIYDELFVRHWDTWKDGRRSHLFTMPCEGGRPRDLMSTMDADTPSKPFGGREEITFTPDSRQIIFTARNVGKSEAWSTDFDLYCVPVDASEPLRCITESNRAWDTNPLFSPDGKTLAYLAMERPGYESDRLRIILRPWPEGKSRVLTGNWERSPSQICWSPDSKTIYATAANLGQKSLFAIDVTGGGIRTLVKKGCVRRPLAGKERVFFGLCNLKSPVELYSIKIQNSKITQLTFVNAGKIAAAKMGDYEQFTFKGYNDETVYCYVVKPVDLDPSHQYPVAFLIHGGPQGSFNNNFHYRWNPQVYAASGYAAVMVDFHGSVGYGQAFTDSVRGDWGGKPLVDLQKGLKAALKKYPWMAPGNVAALGASFGGYMINWLEGKWPGRFRCMVNHDGNLDERLAYFQTDELWFPEWDHLGTPWENPQGYEKHNPINYVRNWKTPMLVIHGAHDFRVVDTQGIATFTALQRQGIPSRLLYFPDENHWVLKPHNSILWHNTVLDWLERWCGDN